MPVHAPAAEPTAPKKRGPKTPEGKARSSRNALKHGLRSRSFALLAEEDPAEWALHLAELRRDLAPDDPTEEKLVAALAVAMWKEVRADRAEAGVLARMASEGDLGCCLGEERHALSLGTAVRYATAAGMATQRAHRAFLAHRKAKQQGLILPAREPVEVLVDQNGTNDFPGHAAAVGIPPSPAVPGDAATSRTNNLPATRPVAAHAAAAGEEHTNDFPNPGATGPAAEPRYRHARRRLGALARQAARRAA